MTMRAPHADPVTYGRRLSVWAATQPDHPAIVFAAQDGAEDILSWTDLDRRSSQLARLLETYGVGQGATVGVGLLNSLEHYLVTYAVWKLGATILPLRAAQPTPEREAILALAQPTLVVADWDGGAFPLLRSTDLAAAATFPSGLLPDRVAQPVRALASGGSTGRPKLIVSPGPSRGVPGQFVTLLSPLGFRPGQTQLVAAPLYHAMPNFVSHAGLFEGHTLIVMERFDAARVLALIERHRVSWGYLAPIMMKRIIESPGVTERDLSSLESICSTAAPVPPWLKRAWIDLLGPERVSEAYLMSEAIGMAAIRGDEWLTHPGSVGRPHLSTVRILDEAGQALPPHEVGEIFLQFDPVIMPPPRFAYVGSPPAKTTSDGLASVGDMGWLDEDGYLYIAERRVDMIVTGGANVYAAEVEAALTEHPEVADVAVIGVPDPEWGRRVHAVIQPRDSAAPPAVVHLDQLCRTHLAAYKAPKTYEFVAELPRNDAGKIRRSGLAEERASGWTAAMLRVS